MSEILLNASARSVSGKGGARQLRAAEMIPGVFYGHNEPTLHFAVSKMDLGKLLRTHHTIISLKLGDDAARPCVIRQLQRDPVNGSVIHLDLLSVHTGEKMTFTVPIKLVGTPIGVKQGGILEHGLSGLDIECLPADLPEVAEVDVSGLNVGQTLHVSELNIPNIRILDDPHASVAHVAAPTVERAHTAATEETESTPEAEG
jgi:large subunit ribosomal protein L25